MQRPFNSLPNVGRVPELYREPTGKAAPWATHATTTDDRYAREAILGVHSADELNQKYFGVANIAALQSKLKAAVFDRCGHAIADQDVNELKLIMRSIYLTYGAHELGNVDGEVAALNQRVLDYAVPDVCSGIVAYLKFHEDLRSMPTQFALPAQSRLAGTKSNYGAGGGRFF